MKTEPLPTEGDFVAVDDHAEWMSLARDAYQRLADTFAELEPDDWQRPTPCEGWTLRHMGGHMVGAMRSAARFRELASQQREIKARTERTGENEVDVMTAVQIRRAESLTPDEVVAELRQLVDAAVAGRGRMPGVLRRTVKLPIEVGSIKERWTMEYLLGCILTRDAWLHRIDLADSLGVAPVLDGVDRTIVGDVAVEWARRHGQPVELDLTGPAGGRLSAGTGGESVTIDAIEFCRVLSGRSTHPHPLLAQEVPF